MVANKLKQWTLEVDFSFSDFAKNALKSEFLRIRSNPYSHFREFCDEIDELINSGTVTDEVFKLAETYTTLNEPEHPFFLVANCPIDDELPIFDNRQPVKMKYLLKRTYVSEAFLILYAKLCGQFPLGYTNVNSGDYIHDIYPQRDLFSSQSQKTLKPIGFHKDLANHYVRPDFVNILSLRNPSCNEIYTSFVRNIDLIAVFTEEEKELLRQKIFFTPFDDLSYYGNKNGILGSANEHAILKGLDIVFFEWRTKALTPEGEPLVRKLEVALHELKDRRLLNPGELVGINNNLSLHGKDVGNIGDPILQKQRWLMKTVNSSDLKKHEKYFVEDDFGMVNG